MAVYSVTILAESLEQVTALADRDLDLHRRAARRRPADRDYAVPALLTDEQVAQLRADGYRVEIHEDADQLAIERSADVAPEADRFAPPPARDTTDPDRQGPAGTAPGEQRPAPGATLELLMDLSDVAEGTGREAPSADAGNRAVLGGYLTATEVESALSVLAATYPALVSVVPLPEPTEEGRTSSVVQLRAGTGPPRTGVLITGGVHAREWGGSDICVALATNLLRSYSTGSPLQYGRKTFPASDVRAILDTLDVFVAPDVNPDGKAYSQTIDPGGPQSFWWRKNRRREGLPGTSVGVDVNRNFDFLWSSGIGTSADADQLIYKGTAAFSEPESRNVRWLLDTHENIGFFVDVHSYGELVLYSWGDDENQVDAPDQNFLNPAFDGKRGVVGDSVYREFIPSGDQAAVRQLAEGMNAALAAVRGGSYSVEQAVGLYPTSGASDDYSFSRHRADPDRRKVYAFTVEFGQQFVPPYAEMRGVMADVAAALTELCRRAAGT
jgi:murein tripeptide amidase MpaA